MRSVRPHCPEPDLNIIRSQSPAQTAAKIATRMDDPKLVEDKIEHIRDVMSIATAGSRRLWTNGWFYIGTPSNF